MNKKELRKIIIEELQQYSFGQMVANRNIPDKEYPRLPITGEWIEKLANNILAKIPDEVVIAEGEIGLCSAGFEGALSGVYITTRNNVEIGLNEFLTEQQAIQLDGKKVRLTLEEIIR